MTPLTAAEAQDATLAGSSYFSATGKSAMQPGQTLLVTVTDVTKNPDCGEKFRLKGKTYNYRFTFRDAMFVKPGQGAGEYESQGRAAYTSWECGNVKYATQLINAISQDEGQTITPARVLIHRKTERQGNFDPALSITVV